MARDHIRRHQVHAGDQDGQSQEGLLGFEHLLALPELRLHPHRRRDEEAAGKVDSQQPRRLRTRRAVILAERLRQPVDNVGDDNSTLPRSQE